MMQAGDFCYSDDSSKGGIRTLGTGYPVRQISNATPGREQRHLGKTPQNSTHYGKMAR
jgi:hypothetical protein